MSPTIQVRVLRVRYFASIREALGEGHGALSTQANTVGALRAELMARFKSA